MAGANETPRQRMIGMMYLVLTALLALQVSNDILNKFIFIDESVRHSVKLTRADNERSIQGIASVVEKNGNRPQDLEIVKKSEQVRDWASEAINEIKKIRDKIIEIAGKDENGQIDDKGGYDAQMHYTIGPEGSKKGEAYVLQQKLNAFIEKLNTVHDSLNMPPIALDAKDMEIYKDDPDQRRKDFAELQFQNTPNVAALAILSQLKSQVAQAESKAIELLSSEVGADQLRVDKVIPVVKPESKIVAAGTKYEAEMFIAAVSSSLKPKMTFGGKEIKVDKDGKGKVSFVASGGGYDKDGNVTKSWKGTIKVQTPLGEQVLEVDEKYTVAKPVISIQAAAVSALYFNCGNELNVQVPALGSAYDPSFSANGASVIKGGKKGFITLIPKDKKVTLSVRSSGNLIGSESFRVRAVPKPEIVPIGTGNKKIDLKNGVSVATMPRVLTMAAVADEDFKSFLPKDARYKVTRWEITLARGRRAIAAKKVSDSRVNISDFAASAKEGDRIVVEIKQVKRRNFQDQEEVVSGMDNIINIPIN